MSIISKILELSSRLTCAKEKLRKSLHLRSFLQGMAIHPKQMSEDALPDVVAAAESFSHHPIAESIVAAHKSHSKENRTGSVTEHSGLGIEAVIDGRTIYVGDGINDAPVLPRVDIGIAMGGLGSAATIISSR